MKQMIMATLVVFSSIAYSSEFERGYNAGLKACTQENYYVCSANVQNPKLKTRSMERARAIKELYDYCNSPSRSVYRNECDLITNRNQVDCLKL